MRNDGRARTPAAPQSRSNECFVGCRLRRTRSVRHTLIAVFSLLALPSSLLAIPSDYTPLTDGLRFSGSQRVETVYCHTGRDRIECEITVDEAQPNASAAVFGTEGAGDVTRSFAFYVKTDGDDVATFTFGGSVSGAWFPRGVRTTLRLEPANADWETLERGSGSMQLRGASPEDGLTPLVIGNVNAAGYPGDVEPGEAGIAMKLHGFRIWYGGLELLHDYVPCRNGAGEEGLYDTVSGDFLPIKGAVTPTPPEPEQPVITAIVVDQTNDVVRVEVRAVEGVMYALRRSATVAPRSAYTNIVASGVAKESTLALYDRDSNRPKDRAFYDVVALTASAPTTGKGEK